MKKGEVRNFPGPASRNPCYGSILRVVLVVTAPLAQGNSGCCSLHERQFHKVFVPACFLPKEVGVRSVGFRSWLLMVVSHSPPTCLVRLALRSQETSINCGRCSYSSSPAPMQFPAMQEI